MPSTNVDQVKEYYDSNTSIFIKVGRSKERQNIHRQIWKDTINTAAEATLYLNDYILKEIKTDKKIKKICDLGCGVGATLFHLSERLSKQHKFSGYTISPQQVRLANKFKITQNPNNNCQFEVGDFHQLPVMPQQDLIYAIESFVHANQPQKVLAEVSKHLKKDGTFILMDDTLGKQYTEESKKTIDTFKKGWHLGNLLSIEEIEALALQNGLVLTKKIDYTSFIKLWRFRDYFIHFLLFFYAISPVKSVYFESLAGGDALQTGLKKRWIEFWVLHFKKV